MATNRLREHAGLSSWGAYDEFEARVETLQRYKTDQVRAAVARPLGAFGNRHRARLPWRPPRHGAPRPAPDAR